MAMRSLPLLLFWGSRAGLQEPWAASFSSRPRALHLPPLVMPPLIFAGLFVALWCWKCTMLIVFQNAIIYNPFLPPDARSMRIADFARLCAGIRWREERIRSSDGTSLALCVSEMFRATVHGRDGGWGGGAGKEVAEATTPVYILYFQGTLLPRPCLFESSLGLTPSEGNASSLPPRLPAISSVISSLKHIDQSVHYTTVCLSYRGYWTSHDRPSEGGINLDAQAALQWTLQLHRSRLAANDKQFTMKPVVLLWGQSIGCGFATNLAALHRRRSDLSIDALILETPFTNTRAMLKALYPQRWLPYQYLWPFLRNHLDSWNNIGLIARECAPHPPRVCIVEAGKDELVPQDHGALLHQRCQDVGLDVERTTIRGALHNQVVERKDGKQAIARFILIAVERAIVKAT